MNRTIWTVTALLLVSCTIAIAEEDDRIMGNYLGEFTSDGWADRYIRAQVVAESKTAHRVVLFIGKTDTAVNRLEVKGRSRDGKAVFKDTLDLSAFGGAFKFAATIENERLTGTLQGRGEDVDFELKRVFLEPPTRGMVPPEGAVSLFDGTNITNWERTPLHWCLTGDSAMEVCSSNFKTLAEYGSGLYHIEFRTPFMPTERGQGRGNSGVYLLGRYEVQVLDSFGVEPADNLCGGIYSFATPIADAVLPPLQWQTYDITFTAPTFDENGNKRTNARIHALHNGIVIHDNVELDSGTPGGVSDKEASQGPLLLQDHHNRVRFRNIWFKPAE